MAHPLRVFSYSCSVSFGKHVILVDLVFLFLNDTFWTKSINLHGAIHCLKQAYKCYKASLLYHQSLILMVFLVLWSNSIW